MNKAPVTPRWELKFGKLQVFIFSILFTACMGFCFYLGFTAGRTTGHDQALARALASSSKLPIQGSADDESIDSQSKDIYAALQEVPEIKPAIIDKKPVQPVDKDIPELASLPSISASDVESSATNSLSEALGEPSLEGAKAASNTKTLADLATHSEKQNLDVKHIQEEKVSTEKSKIIEGDKNPSIITEGIKPLSETTTTTAKNTKEIIAQKEKISVETMKTEASIVKKEEPKKEEIKKVEPKKEEIKPKAVSGGWFAQVAAPETLVDATAITKKLRASGFSASVENANVRGQTYYRILVGPEDNKEQGERLIQQLKRESYLSGAPFSSICKIET